MQLFSSELDAAHLLLALFCLVLLGAVFWLVMQLRQHKALTEGSIAAQSCPKASSTESAATDASHNEDIKDDAAVHLLALFQQEGRLVDFLLQELDEFSDEQVGASARVVHQGARKVLSEYFEIAPIHNEPEESQVTIKTGFDAQSVRLVGALSGQGPFKGILLHRGWRSHHVSLPKRTSGFNATIIAPAEVEV